MANAFSFGQKNDTIISTDCNLDGILDSLKLEAISEDSKFELKISNDSAWSLYYCDKDNFHYKPEAIFDIPNHLLKPNNIGCKKIIQDYIFKEFSQNNTNEIDWYFQYEKNKKSSGGWKDGRYIVETFWEFKKDIIDAENLCIGCKQLKTFTINQSVFEFNARDGVYIPKNSRHADSVWVVSGRDTNELGPISKITINNWNSIIRVDNLFYLKEKDTYSILFLDYRRSNKYSVLSDKNEVVLCSIDGYPTFTFIDFKLGKLYELINSDFAGYVKVTYKNHELKGVLADGEIVRQKIIY